MEGKILKGTFAEYLEIDRAEIDDYLDDAGFVEGNYAKIATAWCRCYHWFLFRLLQNKLHLLQIYVINYFLLGF